MSGVAPLLSFTLTRAPLSTSNFAVFKQSIEVVEGKPLRTGADHLAALGKRRAGQAEDGHLQGASEFRLDAYINVNVEQLIYPSVCR